MLDKAHGNTIILRKSAPGFRENEGSVFIYDENICVWFLKAAYDRIDMSNESTDIGAIPYLSHGQLSIFGVWENMST